VRLLACRDLQWAWLEYSRAAEYAHDPHALVREELSLLGPAGLCPACAGTPDLAGTIRVWQFFALQQVPIEVCGLTICYSCAGAAEVAAALATPSRSAEHLFEPGEVQLSDLPLYCITELVSSS
jgi:hypothetical protein